MKSIQLYVLILNKKNAVFITLNIYSILYLTYLFENACQTVTVKLRFT